ncbi:MAG: sporulation protein YabP [Lachnospiraceae bacterium]
MEEKQAKTNHKIILNMRKICQITGVIDVISFDENEVLLETDQGVLTLEGKELHVSRLSLEKGELDIDGQFDGFTYSNADSYHKPNESFFKRLLK